MFVDILTTKEIYGEKDGLQEKGTFFPCLIQVHVRTLTHVLTNST